MLPPSAIDGKTPDSPLEPITLFPHALPRQLDLSIALHKGHSTCNPSPHYTTLRSHCLPPLHYTCIVIRVIVS